MFLNLTKLFCNSTRLERKKSRASYLLINSTFALKVVPCGVACGFWEQIKWNRASWRQPWREAVCCENRDKLWKAIVLRTRIISSRFSSSNFWSFFFIRHKIIILSCVQACKSNGHYNSYNVSPWARIYNADFIVKLSGQRNLTMRRVWLSSIPEQNIYFTGDLQTFIIFVWDLLFLLNYPTQTSRIFSFKLQKTWPFFSLHRILMEKVFFIIIEDKEEDNSFITNILSYKFTIHRNRDFFYTVEEILIKIFYPSINVCFFSNKILHFNEKRFHVNVV